MFFGNLIVLWIGLAAFSLIALYVVGGWESKVSYSGTETAIISVSFLLLFVSLVCMVIGIWEIYIDFITRLSAEIIRGMNSLEWSIRRPQ